MRVLVAEDDDGVAGALVSALRSRGHATVRASRAAEVWSALADTDLVLLDLGLPDADGLDVLRAVKRTTDVAVLVLTARGSPREVEEGLRLGADDYLVKPVRMAHLMARVEALAARIPTPRQPADVLHVGELRLDVPARRATLGTRELALRPAEFALLDALARRPGSVVGSDDLVTAVHGAGGGADVDGVVARVRGVLGSALTLTAVAGGYRLGR